MPGIIAKVENSWLGYQSVTKGAETYTDISAISLIDVDVNNTYESKKQ